MTKQIAVTGASGFIGRSICRHLHAQGWQLRLLMRSPAGDTGFDKINPEIIRGDVHDEAALARLVDGVSAVIHCAGVVRGASQEDFDSVNVGGLSRLLDAIQRAEKAPRLFALSSLAAREPALSFYAASKRRGEALLEQQGTGLDWFALRPPAVYGPGDREMLPLFRAMAKGFAPVPGNKASRFSMVFVDDIAELVAAWLERETVAPGIYTLHDGRTGGYNWSDVCQIASEICHRTVRPVEIPSLLLDIPAWLNTRMSRWFGYAPMLTPEKLRELRHMDWVCDNAGLSEALGWQPRVQLREGLLKTPGWSSVNR
ncbi:nucleoside-diphosphate-sugar epimerase [Thiogranum longum]|uniref:Nucleoside-diphosphate-sugar epimerase n=1 Tax=Thiogranum longum TaxID=1537524 RepID=A0A4V2PH25_9GAMM|nr:SDR family NAD(P)-dependent oxidoreductase [Thiogranum longum]TCK19066.1 nucleoside-diphosphate-sugar epimerase [Thiogranum longum]